MSKIWEIDFTSFSGVSNTLYDQVGTQHLTETVGTISKQEPLLGFTNRRGIYISSNSEVQRYNLYNSPLDISNGRFTDSYNQRSFVLWIYIVNMGNATYWDTTSNLNYRIPIWGTRYLSTEACNVGISIVRGGVGVDILPVYNTPNISYSATLSTGWHSIIVLNDRLAPLTQLYIDGVFVGSSTTVLAAATPGLEAIGEYGTQGEGSYYLGSCSTFDHILSPSEITAIHNSFLVDTEVGPSYYQTFSGNIYGLDGDLEPNVNIYAYSLDLNRVVHETQSTSSGTYEMVLPYSGNYMILAENGVYGGMRSFPAIATSGNVYFP